MPVRAKSRPYHHGDLRAALLATTLQIIREHGPDALNLRDLARRAGVSEAAPYHHFRSKTELLATAAAEGFRQLGARMEAAVAAAGRSADARAIAAGCAYVRFALDEPGYFRLLFGAHVVELAAQPEAAEAKAAGQATAGLLRQVIADVHAERGIRVPQLELQRLVWAQVHGLAWLVLERELRPEPTPDETVAMARRALQLLFDGAGSGRRRRRG